MFNLTLDWDIPNHLDRKRPQTHFLRARLTPTVQAGRGLPTRMAIALDVSSSMGSENKLARAKEALLAVVRQLRPEDRLSVAAYSGTVTPLFDGIAGGPGAVRRAEEALARLSAEGITRMDLALDWLGRAVPDTAGTVRVAILITDGEPTTAKGVVLTEAADLDGIKERGHRLRSSGLSLWALGLGNPSDFNGAFLEDIAPGGFMLAADPATLSARLQHRLSEAQSMATEGMRLIVRPLMDGAKAKAFCRIAPTYAPLDMPSAAGAPVFAGPAASGGPTDYLIEFEVPPPPMAAPMLGGRPASTPADVALVRIESADGRFSAEQKAVIIYTASVSESQKRDREVDQARLLWEMNLCGQKATSSTDRNATREFFVQMAVAAEQAGRPDVAVAAKENVQELDKSGDISKRRTTELFGLMRDDILPRKPDDRK
ncbi:VWA domain-containing protein [Magnetospirillum sp. 15-1]|uniref:vWA domain-containing protein n=1 Tax=Magnetospirillum sp. 15-1 TaxID=1979370 RepID=UPI000BBC54D5|nr:VWA domain-containing protein [Magnetospirillum sp. 15-1]